MEDALDAFTEAAAGRVEIDPVPEIGNPASGTPVVVALREKACALLGAWTAAQLSPQRVRVGDADLDAPLLIATAALEITVHGWDVGQATGRRTPIPHDLARGLLAIAQQVIDAEDRGPRFASPRPTSAGAGADEKLLAWTGRGPAHMTGPPSAKQGERPTHRGMAS
jgi:uncharacterized protein (TIGR03086 family)